MERPLVCDCARCIHRERSICNTCEYKHDYRAYPEGPRDEDEPLSKEDEHICDLARLTDEEYERFMHDKWLQEMRQKGYQV